MDVSKEKGRWDRELRWAEVIAKPFGCVVEKSPHAYEVARIKSELGVLLVIYPHKTSAGNHYARARDAGSKNKEKAAEVMAALENGEGLPENEQWEVKHSCVFNSKSK
jgi:hypothetical protein